MSPMPSLLFLICSCFSAVSPAVSLPASTLAKPTAYEVLVSFNFPTGILPKGVFDYDLDPDTGEFSAYLNQTCTFTIQDSYELRYQTTITGTITKNHLSNLKGVSVKVLFFWVSIIEVTRSGDELEFSVGILSANFPVDNFDECPQCGCGLDCNGVGTGAEGGKIKLRVPF